MNKTVKTIAWICLVLGLMGLAADAAAIVYGQRILAFAPRDVKIEIEESIEFKGDFMDVDEDGDVDKDDLEAWRSEHEGDLPFGKFRKTRDGFKDRFDATKRREGFFGRGYIGGRGFGFPIFLLALGPVLTVIGAVTLIVNREPKKTVTKPSKSRSKKS